MPSVSADANILRLTERRDLLRALNRLASPDPAERDRGALRAVELVQRHGLSWDSLLPAPNRPARARSPSSGGDAANVAWPAAAVRLLEDPGLTREERQFLEKISAWRRPGRDGVAQVEAIARRLQETPCARGLAPGSGQMANAGPET